MRLRLRILHHQHSHRDQDPIGFAECPYRPQLALDPQSLRRLKTSFLVEQVLALEHADAVLVAVDGKPAGVVTRADVLAHLAS